MQEWSDIHVLKLFLSFLHRMEVDGWDSSLEEELGISLDELKKWIEDAVEKSEIVQKKKAQLTELKEWVEQKEEEEAVTEKLLKDANQWAEMNLFLLFTDCFGPIAFGLWRLSNSQEGLSRLSPIAEHSIQLMLCLCYTGSLFFVL